MQVNGSILKQLSCLKCHEIMHPPIKICMLGHNFCTACDSISLSCPICNCIKSLGKNILLENLHHCFMFQCNNRRDGCEFVGKGPELKQHQMCCQYTVVPCPLKVFGCAWRGRRAHILEHAENNHAENLIELKQPRAHVVISTQLLPSTFIRMIIKLDLELFLFTWCISSDCTVMRWQIIYLGSSNPKKFQYNIELYDPLESFDADNGPDNNCKKRKNYIEFTDDQAFEKFTQFGRVRCRASVTRLNEEMEK